jgi:hypothetical protein
MVLLQDAVVIVVLVLSSLKASLGDGTAAGCSGDRRAGALLVASLVASICWAMVLLQDAVTIVDLLDALQDAVQSWRMKDMFGCGEAHGEVLSQLRALRDELGAEANHNEYASSTKRKRNSAGASAEGIPSKRG